MLIEVDKPGTETMHCFFPVATASLDASILAMDLYFRPMRHTEPVLYRSTGVEFCHEDRLRLIEQGVEYLYVPMKQHSAYRRQLLDQLAQRFNDPDVQRSERARVVRKACAKMIDDVMVFPGHPETLNAVGDISRYFARWSREGNGAFSHLLDMSAHDFYTTTHMVNVGVACGMLMQQLAPDDEVMLNVVIQGGLLHDVGKRGVPETILNKDGKLTDEEWKHIKGHPDRGWEELRRCEGIPPIVLKMVREHHERLDGKGYPQGLVAEDLELPTRICTVVDVFDAICAARPYRGPTPPQKVLEIMRSGLGTQFDPDLFEHWSRLVERMIDEDPRRAGNVTDVSQSLSLGSVVQCAPAAPERQPVGEGEMPRIAAREKGAVDRPEDRRAHPRRACKLAAAVRFLWQGKAYPVHVGESFECEIRDLSRGGALLITHWPLSLNDMLALDLAQRDGGMLHRTARVVRIRRFDEGTWFAGVRFEADADADSDQ